MIHFTLSWLFSEVVIFYLPLQSLLNLTLLAVCVVQGLRAK